MKPTELFNNYFDEFIILFPSCNDYLNLSKYKYLQNQLENNLSEDHIKKQKLFYKKYAKLCNEILLSNKTISYKNVIYINALKYMCLEYLKSFKYNYNLIPITHMENIVTTLFEQASGTSYYNFKIKKDYSDFLEKIQIYPQIIQDIIKNMREGIKRKYTLPIILAEKVYKQLIHALKNKVYINKNIKNKLNNDFNKELKCVFEYPTKLLITFLKKEYIPRCRKTLGLCFLDNGKEEYKFLAKMHTSKTIPIEKIHKYGIQEMKRIIEEKNKIKNKLGFKGNLIQFDRYLKNRKDLKFRSRDELLKLYTNQINSINKNIMPKYFSETVKNKCIIIPVPKYNEEFSSEAYYMPGDIEGYRKGKFYINLRDFRDNTKMDIESLTLHEASPGHHYQITLNNEQNIPLFLKCYNNDAFAEGWALYCENLGEYKLPESYYGKLNMEMERALRLVVDTGIHYYGWTFNKTFIFMRRHLFQSDTQIKKQILRYSAIPGQALSYKIGEKIILDLQTKFKGNTKQFHKKILEYGPIPLHLLEKTFY